MWDAAIGSLCGEFRFGHPEANAEGSSQCCFAQESVLKIHRFALDDMTPNRRSNFRDMTGINQVPVRYLNPGIFVAPL